MGRHEIGFCVPGTGKVKRLSVMAMSRDLAKDKVRKIIAGFYAVRANRVIVF